MPKGPHLNKIKKSFTTRDSLGIEGVATSIAADICPIVTTVTPRAFYWPFMVWIYYDFYKYSGIKEHNVATFDKYVKKQDYFFVMATLLNKDSDKRNLVGITQCEIDINENPSGPYEYNPKYFKTSYGGMQYYNGGCDTMYFIKDRNLETGEIFNLARLTTEGEKLALSFEEVIKDTEYYKSFRLKDTPVPRNVLEEYGKVINMGLLGFEKSKSILKHRMFDNNPQLMDCADYVRFLYDNYSITDLPRDMARKILFDHISPSSEAIVCPSELKRVADQWEIFVGRQYFTSGLEMIWKSMLMKIEEPASKKEWMERMISRSEFTWNIEDNLETVIPACIFDYETRENMIKQATRGKNPEWNLENGIKLLLSIYNWMETRDDLEAEVALLSYGADNHSISLKEFKETVEKYKVCRIVDFMIMVMDKWLCEQHYITAFNKLMQGRDGFYFELVDGLYRKKYDFEMGFQAIRMVQLMQIMKDLNMLD